MDGNWIVLYKNQPRGMSVWQIRWNKEFDQLEFEYGVEHGSMIKKLERIEMNKSGRNLFQQASLRMESRISKQLDKGYKRDRVTALKDQTNQMGLVRPTLAQAYTKMSATQRARIGVTAMMQRKLDGHRCMIMNHEDLGMIAYTRQGKQIDTIRHILDHLIDKIPVGTIVDGELYQHGIPLQTISSRIKRYQHGLTEKLMFVAFDMVSDKRFIDRHNVLSTMLRGCDKKRVLVLPKFPYVSETAMWEFFYEGAKKGFEGVMLRLDGVGYEKGIRSKNLIKVKEQMEDDFEVVDINPSVDGWAILTCRMQNGLEFDTSAPGTVEQKTDALHNKENLIGQIVNVKYACLTNAGRPFHAVATRWISSL